TSYSQRGCLTVTYRSPLRCIFWGMFGGEVVGACMHPVCLRQSARQAMGSAGHCSTRGRIMPEAERSAVVMSLRKHTQESVGDRGPRQPCVAGSRASGSLFGCQPLGYLAPWSNMARQANGRSLGVDIIG